MAHIDNDVRLSLFCHQRPLTQDKSQSILPFTFLNPFQVGSLVNELDSLGVLDNTYIIFTSDNGFHLVSVG